MSGQLNLPYEPGQDYPNRRGPRVASAGGDGQTIPFGVPGQQTGPQPPPPTGAQFPGIGGILGGLGQQPGASQATQAAAAPQPNPTMDGSFSPEQTSLLSQQDPNFLIDYANRQQGPAAPAPPDPAFAQLNASMGNQWFGQDTGLVPHIYDQRFMQPGETRPGSLGPNWQFGLNGPPQQSKSPPAAPAQSPLGGGRPQGFQPIQFPNLTRRMGYGAGGGYGTP